MSDLAEFLLARISEDEAVARAALGRGWEAVTDHHQRGVVEHSVWAESSDPGPSGEYVAETVRSRTTAAHIARHDPARVLAECEAKRRIVEEFTITNTATGEAQASPLFRLLALPFADHPDYDEAWRP